mmetsp:Transcript_72984/g.171069  ORF Transcript_72984/g.171069 Transcript_72984/m.171069 type:complete len:255 (-) Transcript_72984:113-877(-)
MPPPQEWSPGERLTCQGLGWVRFDTDLRQKQLAHQLDGTAGAVGLTPPEIRCLGSSSRSRSAPGGDRSPGSWSQVETTTWALICGGQLRMMTPRPASDDKDGETSDPSMPTLWQCEGVSFRIERVPVDDHTVTQAQDTSSDSQMPLPSQEARQNEVDGEELQLQDVATGLVSGARAVAVRARSIVTFWGGERKAPQSLTPGGFAVDVARASRRICMQAGKISQRSVEQAGKLMSFPFRLASPADATPKPGQDAS